MSFSLLIEGSKLLGQCCRSKNGHDIVCAEEKNSIAVVNLQHDDNSNA
ncbi:hypothetical protein [Arsenophonus sp.]